MKTVMITLALFFLQLAASQAQPPLVVQVMRQQPTFPAHLNLEENNRPKGRLVREGLFRHVSPIFETYHHQRQIFAGTAEGNLYLRKPESEELEIIANSDGNREWDIADALWSPDGKYLWVKKVDHAQVPRITLTLDSGKTYQKPYSKAGQPIAEEVYFVVEVETREVNEVQLSQKMPYIQGVGWSDDSDEVYFMQSDRLMKEMHLSVYSVALEKSRTIFEERADTYQIGLNFLPGYGSRFRNKRYVSILENGFLWQSERSGFNQIYLYDSEGRLIRQLTSKERNGIVRELSHVDEENGWVYYVASADSKDPFKTQLFRTSIRSGTFEKIVDGPVVFQPTWNATNDSIWLLQALSPYQVQLNNYTANGQYIKTEWESDLEFTREYGYDPEYLSVELEQGNTAEVMILKPRAFDPGRTYPVIEYIYGGAFKNEVPRHPFSPAQWQLQVLANEGFVVVIMDTRGTPGKGKTFQDYSYGRMGQVEIDDHAAVLEHLAHKLDYFDITRVGVLGHSWGGYFALRAMIMRPDLYKAAHVNAPGVDPLNFRIPVEIYMGCLPKDCPDKYEAASVTSNIHLIKGPVQIIHGTADDDVPVTESRQLVAAFNAAGKVNVEYLEWPGVDHIVMRERKWQEKVNTFFTTHLLDKED